MLGECEYCFPTIYQVAQGQLAAKDAAAAALFTTEGVGLDFMAKNQITLIGCGKMGSAMLEGWLGDASLDAQFTIIEPRSVPSRLGCQRTTCFVVSRSRRRHSNNAKASTMIVLAVKPQMMDDALAAIGHLNVARSAYPIHRRRYFNSLVETAPWSDYSSNACNAKHTGGCWQRVLQHYLLMHQILFVIWPTSCYWRWAKWCFLTM